MSDERLLRALGQVAREQEAAPVAPELLSPPDAAIKNQIVARGLAALEGAAGKAEPPKAVAAVVTPITAARKPRPRSRWRLASGVGASLALAACALLWVNHQRGGTNAAAPAYSMITSGGVAEQRSAAPTGGEALIVEPGIPVEVILRPASPTSQPLGARFFWVRGERVQHWPVEPERSSEGALRVRGRALSPFGAGGGELVAIVAPASALPEHLRAADLRSPPRGWQVFRREVVWR